MGFINLHEELDSFLTAKTLPDHDQLLSLIDNCVSVLESEPLSYRPQTDTDHKPGGLLDFTLDGNQELPLVVVPDLHARGSFIINMLNYTFAGGMNDAQLPQEYRNKTVLSLLRENKIRIVCVGDALHSEMRGMSRWIEAFHDFRNGIYDGKPMTEEMLEGISLIEMITVLKTAFPANFHFLKGNHENILNEDTGGNYSFVKFADEGNMVPAFIRKVYGDAILHVWSCWEHALPVCAVFSNCVVSHAEPRRTFSRKEIINYHDNEDVVSGLTWTDNDDAENGSVENTMVNLIGKKRTEHAVWFGGHRPVEGTYALRQNGKYVQIHNPDEQNVAIVIPGKIFNPEKDIYSVQ